MRWPACWSTLRSGSNGSPVSPLSSRCCMTRWSPSAAFDLQFRAFADRRGGAADAGRLLDERQDCRVRSCSRESEAAETRIASEPDQRLGQSDVQPNAVDRRSDIPERVSSVDFRRTGACEGSAFAFVVGIIVGTYSSIFIATPIVVLVQRKLDSERKTGRPLPVTAAPARGRAPAKAS